MFVPPIYRTTRTEQLDRVIRDHPLALLVTNGPDAPLATHLPVIPESPTPSAAGATLLGHMNRANPQWAALAGGARARLVFAGPSGYISPTVYEVTPAAPTWNFTAVHVYGTIEPIEGTQATLGVIRRTVETYEAAFGTGWDPEPSLGYHRDIVPGVGAFRFTVVSVDGQLKLSQEKDPDTRHKVIEWFDGSKAGAGRDLAAVMRRNEQAG